MFSKIALFAAASMVIFVAAAPAPGGAGGINNSCNTGPVQCCNSYYHSDSQEVNIIKTLLGVVIGPVTGQVGAGCTPVSVIAASGNSCSSQPVCCENNQFNGLIGVGCTPINGNL